MDDRIIASRSSSDEAAFNLLKKLAGRGVIVEAAAGDGSLTCAVTGVLSASDDEFAVTGKGSLAFDVNSVDISSCKFDERLSEPPSTSAEIVLDSAIGVPFASLRLTNGTRITFGRLALSKVTSVTS
jgi:hypothetical protein